MSTTKRPRDDDTGSGSGTGSGDDSDDETRVSLYSFSQIKRTARNLIWTTTLPPPPLPPSTIWYAMWGDFMHGQFAADNDDNDVGGGCVTKVLQPYPAKLRCIDTPPIARHWDGVRFELEVASKLHSASALLSGDTVSNPPGVLFGFRINVVQRYLQQCIGGFASASTANPMLRNPFIHYGGVNALALKNCAWLMADDTVEPGETIVVVRWPIQPPFRSYVPSGAVASSSSSSSKGPVRPTPVDTVGNDAASLAAFLHSQDQHHHHHTGAAAAAAAAAATMDGEKRRGAHYGDLVYMTWTRPGTRYACKRCDIVGDHYAVACPHYDNDTNTPLPTRPMRTTGIPSANRASAAAAGGGGGGGGGGNSPMRFY